MTGEGKVREPVAATSNAGPTWPRPPAPLTPRSAPYSPAGSAAEVSVWGLGVSLFVFHCSCGGFIFKLKAWLAQTRWVSCVLGQEPSMSNVDGNRKGWKKGLGRAGAERARGQGRVPVLPRAHWCQQCTRQEGRATGISTTCHVS